MEKVDEGNTDHPPGLSLNGDMNHKQQPTKTKEINGRGRFAFVVLLIMLVVVGA